ncbi:MULTISPECIES: AMP-dependent synthetase/ligase [Streptomycetaceae]|uniref:AMP-dependent synthetase/ligase n=1 Tax=Embleya scabrispora TaxID=159449 RepID=UPI0006891E50|nr:AMP-binding protein [Streptomyces sp. SID5474]
MEAAVSPEPVGTDNRPPSIAVDFLERIRATPEREAYRHPVPVGDGDREEWRSLTWGQAGDRAKAIAAGLVMLGVEPEDRVAIVAETRLEWVLADLGIMCAGAATTTVYPTTNADEAAFILADSGSVVAFVADDAQLAKLRGERAALGAVRKVIVFDDGSDRDADDWVITLAALEELGRARLDTEPDLIETRVAAITRDQLATLIYTSGTTGRPKGVRLAHDTWAYQAAAQAAMRLTDTDELQYLWLPLAHCYGKVMMSGQIRIGYPTAIDGRIPKLITNLPIVRPTFMAAAPRVFEKVYNSVHVRMRAEGGLKYKIFRWAIGVGREMSQTRQAGRTPSALLNAKYRLADRLVFAKLRDLFGGRLKGCISGSVALSPDVAEFFDAIGIPILEGYGLTEASAGSSVNRYDAHRIGTVGVVLPGSELRIAEDGELLVRGPAVMQGYHNNPEATAEVLTEDGWLHTGDIAVIEDGFLRITDRKKDLIKTSGGKYVAPSEIEGRFKGMCPYVSNILVHGEGRNFCSALITLDPDAIRGWAAERPALRDKSYEELAAGAEARALIADCLDELNAGLQRWQTVKKFAILPRDLSVEHGELTPSLKVKRRAVEQQYAELLEDMYKGTLVT